MAFRQWIARCGGGLAGKPISPCPPRSRLPFIGEHARAATLPPPIQCHDLVPVVVRPFVPGQVRRAGGSATTFLEDLARRLRAAACGVFFDAESASGSSRAPRLERNKDENKQIIFGIISDDEGGACWRRSAPGLERDKDGSGRIIFSDGKLACRAPRLERNLLDPPRHADAAIDFTDNINQSGPVQGDSGRSSRNTGGMIGTAAGIDLWAFTRWRCCGEFSPGQSIRPASASAPSPSHALLPRRENPIYYFSLQGPPPLFVARSRSVAPFRRVVASNQGAGFPVGGSSGPPLPERDSFMGGSRCVLTRHQHDTMRREMMISAHVYQPRRSMTSGRGRGVVSPHYGPYCKNGRTILKRPAFLPTQQPDQTDAVKYWKFQANVDGVVHESCFDASSLLVKFEPQVYLKSHPLMEAIPILGEPNGTLSWKFTEEGKYTTKSLIDLIGALHDMGCCVDGLSTHSLVINSAGKFELIKDKVELTVLTIEGVRNDYLATAAVLEELIGHDMLAKVPKDISHLFDLMRYDGYKFRYWVQNHVSLLPLQNRATVFMAFFEYITLCMPNVDTQVTGKGKGVREYIPYRKIWAIIAVNNSYLVEWLKYQDKSGGMTIWGSPYQLMHTVRNVIAHKLSLLAQGMVYKDEEVENMLHALFPMLLVGIQEFLWKENRLRKFNLEAFFMDRKVTQPWPIHRRSEK